MAELIIQSGKLQGKRLVLPDKEVFIGRDEGCHVRLASSLISRKHCSLNSTPNGLVVTDLASQNGTFVNEAAITEPTLLQPGDMLQVGAILFQVPAPAQKVIEPVLPKSVDKLAEKPSGASDADIANWLSDEFERTPANALDTTIIKSPTSAAIPEHKPAAHTPLPPTAPPAPAAETVRRPPRTVKEQAAEIIRRHWAEVRGGKPPV